MVVYRMGAHRFNKAPGRPVAALAGAVGYVGGLSGGGPLVGLSSQPSTLGEIPAVSASICPVKPPAPLPSP
jgi:hypothetical protein